MDQMPTVPTVITVIEIMVSVPPLMVVENVNAQMVGNMLKPNFLLLVLVSMTVRPVSTCFCDAGYGVTDDDGVTCANENECLNVFERNQCHTTLATGNDTEGSYSCTCATGYQGNGFGTAGTSMNVPKALIFVISMLLALIPLIRSLASVTLVGEVPM